MMNPPAAWYSDPSGAPMMERYWDGFSWTAQTRSVLHNPPPPPPPTQSAHSGPPGDRYTHAQPAARDASTYVHAFADVTQNNPMGYANQRASYAAESVTFSEALRVHFSRKSTATHGRVSMQQWAWSNFLFTPLMVVVGAVVWWMLASYVEPPAGYVTSDMGAMVLSIVDILNVVARLAFGGHMIIISIKRLHDTGRSGACMFWLLVPVVGGFMYLYWMTRPGVPHRTKFD